MPLNVSSIVAPSQGQATTQPLQHELTVTLPFGEFLPAIPLLTGIGNVKAWKYALRVFLNHYDLLDFIDGTHSNGQAANANGELEPIDAWRKRRVHAYTIINGTICQKTVMPMLLSAGFNGYDDDNYDFNPQTLWDFVCRYIKVPIRQVESLKDSILLHMFHSNYLGDGNRFTVDQYLCLRRYLRENFEVEVQPEVMKRLGVDEVAIGADDYVHLSAEERGKWPTERNIRLAVSEVWEEDDFDLLYQG